MSDTSLPPPRSFSTASDAEALLPADSIKVEVTSDTSLSLPKVLAPVDKLPGANEEKLDNKQKRKRTSPQDQAILEAEYKQNPKPSKAARAEIVEKVNLNEKEVQIWFQNRRQINRRKARPLLPHEIAALRLGSISNLSSDPASIASFTGSQDGEEGRPGSQSDESGGRPGTSLGISPVSQELAESQTTEKVIGVEREGETGQVHAVVAESKAEASEVVSNESSSFGRLNRSFSSAPGYLANRWNAINSSTPPSSSQNASASQSISNDLPSSCPERLMSTASSHSASRVRMSMSLDGKAQLVESNSSPPRPQPPRPSSSGAILPRKRMRPLQRSQSALPSSLLTAISTTNSCPFPRLPTGRPRDARTWEFCCNPDARDELTAQAENESSGSAVAAINLIRSTSNSALKSNTNKRNAPTKSTPEIVSKKPKLGRAQSSLARLQHNLEKPSSISHTSTTKKKSTLTHSLYEGDSDKENWAPFEAGSNARRRSLPSSTATKQPDRSKRILGDNQNIPTHSSNLGGSSKNMNKRHKQRLGEQAEVFEDTNNKEDSEGASGTSQDLEKFMRGEVSPGKKGDLDCIQGLLSLSQGNWR